jgi:tetratricopeptide (TPR) repeat protein
LPDTAGFVGRTAELDRIRSAAMGGQRVIAIVGMAGVGKTYLAAHAGRLLAAEYAFDHIAFVNLHGFHAGTDRPPADAGAVLESLLRLLAVPVQQIPYELSARVAAYRERLAGTRMLVVLDNAADSDQIQPLIADSPGSLTLVTSRRRLSGLQRPARVSAEVLSEPDAEKFLAQAARAIPTGHDQHALARIASRCGYLPLALSLVAGHMRGRPEWTLTDHADRLDQRHDDRRLDSGVEHELDISYQQLPGAAKRLMRLLSLHVGQDFDEYAAAALAGSTLTATRTHLRRLHRDNLLQTASADRYTFHDLVRTYAYGRVVDDEAPSAQHAALTRLFDYYLRTASTASGALSPADSALRSDFTAPGPPAPALHDPDTALAWLDTERPTLIAVAAHAAAHGWPQHAVQLSNTLWRYLVGGHHNDALTIHSHATHAAELLADPTAQARALGMLGTAYLRLGRHETAADNFRQALDLFQQTGYEAGQGSMLNNLGLVETHRGRYRQAAEYHNQAITLFRRAGHLVNEASALGNIARLEGLMGHYQQAADHYQETLALHRRTGNRAYEALALQLIGELEIKRGSYDRAADFLEHAITIYREIGDRTGEAAAMDGLGVLHTQIDRPAEAVEYHHRAITIHRETGYREGEAMALNGLGGAALATGSPAEAITHHAAADIIAIEIDDRLEQARAHTGLGHAYLALNDSTSARHHYQQALTVYTDFDLPEAHRLRTLLDHRLTTGEATGRATDLRQ